ncbi:MAG TPA: cell envelope integrity protein CreD [Candidatus Cloacimonadota bacterium]|nr:cell envelope integrity protein CreD [Candidatus Cloacimonadota bacterium]
MNPDNLARQANSKNNMQMIKLVIIGVIVLVLMIPAVWITFLIHERNERKQSVISEIAGKWGGAQVVSGPFISVPYGVPLKNVVPDGKNNSTEIIKYIHFAPDSLKIGGKIKAVTHKRGIFNVTGYQADLDLMASIPIAVIDDPAYKDLPLRWDEALVSFDLEDQRGLKELTGELNGKPLLFNRAENVLSINKLPEASNSKESKRYAEETKQTDFKLSAAVPVDNSATGIKLRIKLNMTGTQQLDLTTSALKETVTLEGDWKSPSFVGDMLPESRTLDSKGFKATWQTNDLSSGIKKLWSSDEPMPQLSGMGVNFLIMVDSYQQTTRALKYSVLFLVLTFMTFFFAEVMTKQKIHPIQYLMVGCGLLIFYLLLLSISEHLAFGWAYLIAATGVVLQISLYCHSILKTRSFALKIGALLTFLYGFLYLLLRLQDSALLIGSISLFVLLSVAMYIIRNINWYSQE